MSDKIRVAWLGDVHLGYRQYGLQRRQTDFEFALSEALIDIHKQGIDVVIQAGDLLDSGNITPQTFRFLAEVHEALVEKKMKLYTIAGNHDPARNGVHWVDLLRKDADYEYGFHRLEGPVTLPNGLCIAGYSNMAPQDLREKKDWPPVHIMMLHQLVKEFVMDYDPGETALSQADLPLPYCRVMALGDVHVLDIRRTDEGQIIGYAGSTESNSSSEQDDKYWIELQFDPSEQIMPVDYVTHRIPTRDVIRTTIHSEEHIGALIGQAKQVRDKSGRAPVIHFQYRTDAPFAGDLLSRLRKELDPHEYVLRHDPILIGEQKLTKIEEGEEGDALRAPNSSDLVISLLRAELKIKEGDEPTGREGSLYTICEGLLSPGANGKDMLTAFVDERLNAKPAEVEVGGVGGAVALT